MDAQRKLLIGYDLCEDFSQISCYSYKSFEPIPICLSETDEESSMIPTALCVKTDTRLWLFGKDAINCANNGEGILINGLLAKIRSGENVTVFDQEFTGIALLEKFFRKSLTLIKNYFPTDPITKLVITIGEMDTMLVNGIYEALELLGIEKDRALVISHPSAYMYYALSQDRSLWTNDVGLFDFNESTFNYYQISINRRLTPMVAGLVKKDLSDVLDYQMLLYKKINVGYTFENIANSVLHKQIISTLYFTGRGFEGGWADGIIQGLCTGRRAFIGQSMYTKGACYAAKELSGECKLSEFILLNDEMIISSVWLKLYSDAAIKEVLITDAAVAWYEVNETIEIIPDEDTELEIIIKSIMTRNQIRERLHLNDLPKRPNRMTRLLLNLTCTDKATAKLKVIDLGFGEIYPATDRSWEFSFNIL